MLHLCTVCNRQSQAPYLRPRIPSSALVESSPTHIPVPGVLLRLVVGPDLEVVDGLVAVRQAGSHHLSHNHTTLAIRCFLILVYFWHHQKKYRTWLLVPVLNETPTVFNALPVIKGTESRDFDLLFFKIKQYPLGPPSFTG
jgi:hypothetical protein